MQDFSYKLKKIIRCILFFSILIAIFLLLSQEINKISLKDDNLIKGRNKSIVGIQKEKKNSIDVLVVGDSESYCTFSPMVMWEKEGITSYVCGQAGQKVQETYYMLKTAFENQSPKVVVLETNTLFRAQSGVDGMKENLAEKCNYYFPIFRFHDVWKPLLMGTKYAEESYKGFALREVVQSYNGKEYMKETNEKQLMSESVNEYMNQIITLCEENNATLCLVSAPSPKNYNYKKHNTLEAYANEKNLDYVNLNMKVKELQINWNTDSMDKGDHLNFMGAHKVSDYIGTYLKNQYELENHKDQQEYEDWNKEAKTYEASVQNKLSFLKKSVKI